MDDEGRDIPPDEDRFNYTPPPRHMLNNHNALTSEDLEEDLGIGIRGTSRGTVFYRLHEPEDTTSDAVGTIESAVFPSLGTHSRRQQAFNGTQYYNSEVNRLTTFQDWRHQLIVRKEDLARNGFIYTGTSDRVRCIFCNVVLRQWEAGDVVEEEHSRNFPSCPFVLGQDVGNIPYNPLLNGHDVPNKGVSPDERSRTPVHREKGHDIDPIEDRCGASTGAGVYLNGYHHHDAVSGPNDRTGEEVKTHRGTYSNAPINPGMAVEPDRLATFDTWPAQIKQKPRQLAQAGLYYTGDGDKVKCFHCDVTLFNWDPEDDPFVEHARWSSECQYIHLVKGDKFVSDAQKGHGPVEQEMQSPAVLAVLYEGHNVETVQKALRIMKEREGADTAIHAARLLEIVLEIEGSAVSNDSIMKSADENQGSEDVEKLRMENESLRDKQLCKICMDNDVEVVFYPCKHFVCCASCSAGLRECPICRVAIQGIDKVYMS